MPRIRSAERPHTIINARVDDNARAFADAFRQAAANAIERRRRFRPPERRRQANMKALAPRVKRQERIIVEPIAFDQPERQPASVAQGGVKVGAVDVKPEPGGPASPVESAASASRFEKFTKIRAERERRQV